MKTSHMKTLFTLTILSFFAHSLFAQINYVPNNSFENYNLCPPTYSGMDILSNPYIQDWFAASLGTSDYFNACLSGSEADVPDNFASYNQPAHTGNAYAGFFVRLETVEYREYITAQLTSPLTAGECYYVEFWVAPGTGTSSFPYFFGATDAVGAYFTHEKLSELTSYDPVLADAQVDNTGSGNYVDIPGEWEKVQGYFMAEGDEEWITLGNFHGDDETVLEVLPDGYDDPVDAYMFTDDVRVAPFSDVVSELLHDTILCTPLTIDAMLADDATYLWSTGETTPEVTLYTGGTYWITVTTSCGSYSDTADISIFLDSVSHTSSTIELCPDEILYALSTSDTSASYYWNTGENTSGISIDEEGIYYVQSYIGCSEFIDTFYVSLLESPLADFTYTSDGLSYHFENTSTGGLSYAWDFGDGSVSTLADPDHVYTEPGEYIITLTVMNECGSTEYSETIKVISDMISDYLQETLTLYPNPCNGIFILETDLNISDNMQYALLNMTGEVIRILTPVNNSHALATFDISDLPDGLYQFKAISEQCKITVPVILVK